MCTTIDHVVSDFRYYSVDGWLTKLTKPSYIINPATEYLAAWQKAAIFDKWGQFIKYRFSANKETTVNVHPGLHGGHVTKHMVYNANMQ